MSSGVSDQVRLKPTCSATEASMRFQILVTETRDITLSRQRTTKALIRLVCLLLLHGYLGDLISFLLVFLQIAINICIKFVQFSPEIELYDAKYQNLKSNFVSLQPGKIFLEKWSPCTTLCPLTSCFILIFQIFNANIVVNGGKICGGLC